MIITASERFGRRCLSVKAIRVASGDPVYYRQVGFRFRTGNANTSLCSASNSGDSLSVRTIVSCRVVLRQPNDSQAFRPSGKLSGRRLLRGGGDWPFISWIHWQYLKAIAICRYRASFTRLLRFIGTSCYDSFPRLLPSGRVFGGSINQFSYISGPIAAGYLNSISSLNRFLIHFNIVQIGQSVCVLRWCSS
jgi:hypothetical protein